KVGWMRGQLPCGHERFDRSVHKRPRLPKQLIRNDFAMDANALVDSLQMRRSVKPGAQPGGAQYGFQHGRRRTFAVGASNVNAGNGEVWIPQSSGENRNVSEAELLH